MKGNPLKINEKNLEAFQKRLNHRFQNINSSDIAKLMNIERINAEEQRIINDLREIFPDLIDYFNFSQLYTKYLGSFNRNTFIRNLSMNHFRLGRDQFYYPRPVEEMKKTLQKYGNKVEFGPDRISAMCLTLRDIRRNLKEKDQWLSFPKSFRQLEELEELWIHDGKIHDFHNFPQNIQNLHLNQCEIGSFMGLPVNLRELKIENCRFETWEGFPEKLDSLEKLYISDGNFHNFKGFSRILPELSFIWLSNIENLKNFQGFPQSLPRLAILHIIGRHSLSNFEGLPKKLENLQKIRIILENRTWLSLQGFPEILPECQFFSITVGKLNNFEFIPELPRIYEYMTEHPEPPKNFNFVINVGEIRSCMGIPFPIEDPWNVPKFHFFIHFKLIISRWLHSLHGLPPDNELLVWVFQQMINSQYYQFYDPSEPFNPQDPNGNFVSELWKDEIGYTEDPENIVEPYFYQFPPNYQNIQYFHLKGEENLISLFNDEDIEYGIFSDYNKPILEIYLKFFHTPDYLRDFFLNPLEILIQTYIQNLGQKMSGNEQISHHLQKYINYFPVGEGIQKITEFEHARIIYEGNRFHTKYLSEKCGVNDPLVKEMKSHMRSYPFK